MAGSYSHVTTDDGNLRDNESFVKMVENLGDAFETVEEMYGMIWYMATHTPNPKESVKQACAEYREGLQYAKVIHLFNNRQR